MGVKLGGVKKKPGVGQRASKRRRASSPKRARTAAKALGGDEGPIRHVVLLMLENRSFDQMLGLLQGELPGLDGVPPGPPTRFNEDPKGNRYPQAGGAARQVAPDPPHEYAQVIEQIEDGNARFVKSYARKNPDATAAQLQQVMACFEPGALASLHALARHFTVCDHWHASVPGPTWPNRLFAMSGTSLGHVKMPEGIFHPNLHRYEQPSVFRRLKEAKRSHEIYFGDFPLALLLADQRRLGAAKNFSRISRFFKHARRDEAKFPAFSFLEPNYLLANANDDHPPHDVWRGQALVADVYEALRANDPLWKSTLLVVTYDEHGGFYDHVEPPDGAEPPDDHRKDSNFDFKVLGVRVPTILVSPWLDRGVCHERFDHTSLLRCLQEMWGLGDLGRRVAKAINPLAVLPLRATPREDTPEKLPRPKAAAMMAPKSLAAPPLSDHQRAIIAFSEYLDSKTSVLATTRSGAMVRQLQGPREASRVAQERAQRFLTERGAQL